VQRLGGVQKFVAIDFRGDAHAAILSGLHAHDLAVAADVDVAGARDLFGKSDDKFDDAAKLELGCSRK